MIINYMKLIELSESGMKMPPSMLSFAYQCRDLAHFALRHGHTVEAAREAFLAASEEGMETRDRIFERASEILAETAGRSYP